MEDILRNADSYIEQVGLKKIINSHRIGLQCTFVAGARLREQEIIQLMQNKITILDSVNSPDLEKIIDQLNDLMTDIENHL